MDLLERFGSHLESQKKSPSRATLKNYRADIAQFIKWFENQFNSSFEPNAVTEELVQAYFRFRTSPLASAISQRSIKRHLSSLRKFFEYLDSHKFVLSNPFSQSTSPQKDTDAWRLKDFKNALYEYGKKNITIKNYVLDIRQFLQWVEEVTNIKNEWITSNRNIFDHITEELVKEYKTRLLQLNFSPLSINRKLSSLRSYLSWAQKEGLLAPFPKVLPSLSQTDTPTSPIHSESVFPPARLLKKSAEGLDAVIDKTVIPPLMQAAELFPKNLRPLFYPRQIPIGKNISNIPKEFYDPYGISTASFPLHKKIIFQLAHKRPKWYKAYHQHNIVHYFHFAILVVFMSALGIGTYQTLISPQSTSIRTVLSAQTHGISRLLPFSAKLTDNNSNPITAPTDIRFALYNDETASGSALLWEEIQSQVVPTTDGEFTTTLGTKTPLPQSVFSDNSKLFLGVTVGNSQELFPREQLATVSNSQNAQTLSGLSPITNSDAGTANVILALDSTGNLSVGGNASPTFQATGGKFTLSGQSLSLTTNEGTSGNVEIAPDGAGLIDLQKPIHNSTNNNNLPGALGSVEVDDSLSVLATESAQAAFTVNQNGTGTLISASTLGIAKFTINNVGTGYFAGNLGVGTAVPTQKLDVNGNVILSASSPTLFLNKKNYLTYNGSAMVLYADAGDFVVHPGGGSALRPQDDNTNPLGTLTNRFSSLNVGTGTSTFGGPVGIGTTTPLASSGLDVETNSLGNPAVVVNQLGTGDIINASSSGTLKFRVTSSGNVSAAGSITPNGADYAEYFYQEVPGALQKEYVSCLALDGRVQVCDNNNKNLLGVVSTKPGVVGGSDIVDIKNPQQSVLVALLGQVPTRVSTSNGTISAGDPLTTGLSGTAKKAKTSGRIIGYALEDFDGSQGTNCINALEYRCGTIKILVNPTWYDPDVYLTGTGNLSIEQSHLVSTSHQFDLVNGNEIIQRVGAFSSAAIANLQAGAINAKEITADILHTQYLILNTELKSPLAQIDEIHTNIISPLADNVVIKLNSDNSKFQIQNASGSAVATFDNAGNATFSGQLNAATVSAQTVYTDGLQTGSASVSGTLHASKIIAGELQLPSDFLSNFGLVTATASAQSLGQPTESAPVNIATFSAQLAYVNTLNANTATFLQGLMAFGPSSFSDVSVSGQFSVGGNLVLTDNSLNVLGADFSIQPFKQGGVSLEGGLVYIDTDGNLKVGGDAEFAKNLTVKGTLSANVLSPLPEGDLILKLGSSESASSSAHNSQFVIHNSSSSAVFSVNQLGDLFASGSATVNKLNFSLVAPALAVSDTEAIATGSAGLAKLPAFGTQLTVDNPLVSKDSLIYITPVGTPSGQLPFLLRQAPNTSFTVGVESPALFDTWFNWLIIN